MQFAKKSLGQNFLVDRNIIKKILNLSVINKRNIVEIGPGKGALSDEILKMCPSSLILIEKDFLLAKYLKKKYSKNKKVQIFNDDILKFNLEKILKKKTIIFGNLPYNISSQILVKMIKFQKWPPNFSDLIFMFQKELAAKIIGKFKTDGYGRLSILTNLRLNIINKFFVSPNCFTPKPKVISTIIHFKPKKMLKDIKNISKLEDVTNLFFSNKRKMINKNLKKILSDFQISQINKLNIRSRPSEISPEIYYKITKMLE